MIDIIQMIFLYEMNKEEVYLIVYPLILKKTQLNDKKV